MMAPYVEGIRHYTITSENHGAKVLAAAYIMMYVYPPVMAVNSCAGRLELLEYFNTSFPPRKDKL